MKSYQGKKVHCSSLPFLSPGHTSSPLNTRGTSTFNKAWEGALMKVTLRGASVPACKWSWNIGFIYIYKFSGKYSWLKKNNNSINQGKTRKAHYHPGENPDLLNQITGPKLWANLKIKNPRKEKRLAQMLNQFSYLICLNRDEPFVASTLTIFLLENDAGDSTHFSFFGGGAFSGVGPYGNGDEGEVDDDWSSARAAWKKKRRWKVLLDSVRWINIAMTSVCKRGRIGLGA